MGKKQEYIKCNLCGQDSTRDLIVQEPFYIAQCKECGLIYENPRVAEEEVLKLITSDGVTVEHWKTVWHDSKIRLFQNNLKRIERYSPQGRLLDVGCGYGTFLKIAKLHHWQVEGVEISTSASKYAEEELGIRVLNSLHDPRLADNYFDVITMWEVLNQMYNPSGELREAKRVLRPGGLLALRLQNAVFHVEINRILSCLGNLHERLHIIPFVFHPYIFSPQTIRKILEKAGFKDITIEVSEFTSGDPYGTARVFGNKGMEIIKKTIYYLCKTIYYLSAKKLIVSPTMLVFARKP